MSNVFKVIDMIANEGLAIAHETATFIGTIDRQFDESFKPQGAGKKIGGTLRVRNPNEYTRRQGSRVMDVQDQDETTQTITVATQDGVDMSFTSAELALNTDDPDQVEAFSKRYIQPAMSTLISGIDADMLAQFTRDIYNVVGTAGTVVGTGGDTTALGLARARLNEGLAPKSMSDRSIQIDSTTMASITNANKSLFMPDTDVKKAFVEGYYGRGQGSTWYENERTWTLPNGADVAGEIDESTSTNFTQGTSTFHFDGMGNGTVIPAGAVFTIEGVYAVHPETKVPYARLQQFVVTAAATADSGGDVDVSFSPAIRTTGARQNVYSAQTFGYAAWDGKDITFHGAANTNYRQNVMYHKDAFAFVTADLPMMDDAHKCVVKRLDNLSVRVWMGSDIRGDELLVRLDILYGGKTLRPAWGTRISN